MEKYIQKLRNKYHTLRKYRYDTLDEPFELSLDDFIRAAIKFGVSHFEKRTHTYRPDDSSPWSFTNLAFTNEHRARQTRSKIVSTIIDPDVRILNVHQWLDELRASRNDQLDK